jgi:hypothetical protein
VCPQAACHAPAGLHFVENERHVVNLRQQPQLAHEPRAHQAHAALPLDRLDEHGRDATRSADDIGCEIRALSRHEGLEVPVRPRETFVERVHFPPVGLVQLPGSRQSSGYEQVPQLFQAAFLAPRGGSGCVPLLEWKHDVRPVKRRKPKTRLLPVRHRQTAERPAMESSFERHDEPTVTVFRRLHAMQEHRLNRVFNRFGPRVHDEMAGCSHWRNAVQFGFEAEGQRGLVLGMRVARGHERQRLQHGANDRRIVLAEGTRRDQSPHVEEQVRPAAGVSIDDGEIRSNGFRRIERHGQ